MDSMRREYNIYEMEKREIVDQLCKNKNLLPKDILDGKDDIRELAKLIQEIFEEYKVELEKNELFRENFLSTIAYTYMIAFNDNKDNTSSKSKQKNKLYSDSFINHVMQLPAAA